MKNKRKRRKKKQQNKLRIAIIISVIVILLTTFICYKAFLINKYDVAQLETTNYDKFLRSYNAREKEVIQWQTVDNNEYLVYENLKIKNIYKDYKINESSNIDNLIIYEKYDSSNTKTDTLQIYISEESYIDWFSTDDKNFYISIEEDGKQLPLEAEINDYLEKNKITDDESLFKLLSNTRNYTPNIFTSTSKIKDHYGTHLMASITMPAIDKFIELNGDYDGYILIINNIKEVHIIKDGKTYSLTFTNKTEEEILDLISTIVIE